MSDMDFIYEITKRLCEIGIDKRRTPQLYEVEPFKHYFTEDNELIRDKLDEYDGGITRREALSRYILLNVVLDQGPDMIGVNELLKRATTELYRREVRIFHRPIDFFKEFEISIDKILDSHKSVKKIRAEDWARATHSTPSKYNLFFKQSTFGIVSTKQVLDYAVHRWGVPLCVPLLLEKDLESEGGGSPQPLVDYLESFKSAEIMSRSLKEHERYGLGSAIGDKACHLFAKIYVSVMKLVIKKDTGWTGISYEVPFDSNAGRVLFRTGVLLKLATLDDYTKWGVIQKGKGKGGTDYIRVTNIRDKKIDMGGKRLFRDYVNIIVNYMKIGLRPQKVQIQHVPNLFIYRLIREKLEYSVADFDEGLMHIGTNYCFNHENPDCKECPISDICIGYNENESLIKDYRT